VAARSVRSEGSVGGSRCSEQSAHANASRTGSVMMSWDSGHLNAPGRSPSGWPGTTRPAMSEPEALRDASAAVASKCNTSCQIGFGGSTAVFLCGGRDSGFALAGDKSGTDYLLARQRCRRRRASALVSGYMHLQVLQESFTAKSRLVAMQDLQQSARPARQDSCTFTRTRKFSQHHHENLK